MGGAILYAHGNQDVSPSDHQELVVLCSTSCHRNLHWLTASVQPELQGYGQGILSPLLPCAVRLTQYFLPIKQLYLYFTPPSTFTYFSLSLLPFSPPPFPSPYTSPSGALSGSTSSPSYPMPAPVLTPQAMCAMRQWQSTFRQVSSQSHDSHVIVT